MNEGEVVFASHDKNTADYYAEEKSSMGIDETLDEWGNDDPTDGDILDAMFEAARSGDYYEVQRINLAGKTDEDFVQLYDGSEVMVAEILDVLCDSE